MASGPEHDDETPSLASRVLDLLDDDLLGLGEVPTAATPETPPGALDALEDVAQENGVLDGTDNAVPLEDDLTTVCLLYTSPSPRDRG